MAGSYFAALTKTESSADAEQPFLPRLARAFEPQVELVMVYKTVVQ